MRKSLIAAGAIALVMTASACKGDSDSSGAAPSNGSPQAGASAQPGGQKPGGLFSNAGGLADLVSKNTEKAKTSKMSMTMDMGSMKMTMNGEAEYNGPDSKMKMTMNTMGQNMDMVYINRTIYMKMPMGGQAGKPWVKMSADQLSKAGNTDLSKQMQQSDPSHFLDMLEKNGKILSKTPDQVDGQTATKYAAEVDITKMMASVGEKTPPGVDMSKIKPIPMNVWLNSDNLPLQIEMDMGAMMKQIGQSSGQKMPAGMDKAKMVAKYSDWGQPVNVQAPPASQVSDKQLPGTSGSTGGTGSTGSGSLPGTGGAVPGNSSIPSLPGGN